MSIRWIPKSDKKMYRYKKALPQFVGVYKDHRIRVCIDLKMNTALKDVDHCDLGIDGNNIIIAPNPKGDYLVTKPDSDSGAFLSFTELVYLGGLPNPAKGRYKAHITSDNFIVVDLSQKL